MNQRIAEVRLDFVQLLMRLSEEILQQAKFPEQFQSGRVNCVAPKIAKKVLVLFQNEHIDPHAGQKKSQHDAGRTSTRDAAARSQSLLFCSCACLFVHGHKLIDPAALRNGVELQIDIPFPAMVANASATGLGPRGEGNLLELNSGNLCGTMMKQSCWELSLKVMGNDVKLKVWRLESIGHVRVGTDAVGRIRHIGRVGEDWRAHQKQVPFEKENPHLSAEPFPELVNLLIAERLARTPVGVSLLTPETTKGGRTSRCSRLGQPDSFRGVKSLPPPPLLNFRVRRVTL